MKAQCTKKLRHWNTKKLFWNHSRPKQLHNFCKGTQCMMGHTIMPAQYHGSGSPWPQWYSLWLLVWFDVEFIFYFHMNCPWISDLFRNDFSLTMLILLLLNLIFTPFFFQLFFFLCFAVTFHFIFSFGLFLSFIFLFNPRKTVKFWVAALGHHTWPSVWEFWYTLPRIFCFNCNFNTLLNLRKRLIKPYTFLWKSWTPYPEGNFITLCYFRKKLGKISAQPHTTLSIQFLTRENNEKNNTFPSGKQICFDNSMGLCWNFTPTLFYEKAGHLVPKAIYCFRPWFPHPRTVCLIKYELCGNFAERQPVFVFRNKHS